MTHLNHIKMIHKIGETHPSVKRLNFSLNKMKSLIKRMFVYQNSPSICLVKFKSDFVCWLTVSHSLELKMETQKRNKVFTYYASDATEIKPIYWSDQAPFHSTEKVILGY